MELSETLATDCVPSSLFLCFCFLNLFLFLANNLPVGCAIVLSEGIFDSSSLIGFIARNAGQNGGGGGLLLGNGVFKNGWSVTITCMEQ